MPKKTTRITVIKVAEVLREKGMKDTALVDCTGLDRRTVMKYVRGTPKRPSLSVLACIGEALGVSTNRLFEEIEREDLGSAVSRCGEAVIHKSSRTLREAPASDRPDHDRKYAVRCDFLSTWDELASRVVDDYVDELGTRARVKCHPWSAQTSGAPHLDNADEIRDGRAHVLIGSPVTSSFAEYVVSWLFNVTPYDESNAPKFPYVFRRPHYKDIVSAFGVRSPDDEYGIVCNKSGQTVARRVLIESGRPADAEDGGMVVIGRVPVKGPTRNSKGESLVIVLLGLSGPGTLACAEVVCDPANAGDLYPPVVSVPIVRAVTCRYHRRDPDDSRDNRTLVPGSARLVPLPTTAVAACMP